jgi:hypothetical protein
LLASLDKHFEQYYNMQTFTRGFIRGDVVVGETKKIDGRRK